MTAWLAFSASSGLFEEAKLIKCGERIEDTPLAAIGRLLLLAKGSYKPHSRCSDAIHSPYRPRLLELKSVWQISIMF